MVSYKEVTGDLTDIPFTNPHIADVIVHGCNCFCVMRRGIAPRMDERFGCNNPEKYPAEHPLRKGEINKLGTIEWTTFKGVQVVNAYTQYHYNWPSIYGIPLDYDALRMCMRKINVEFQGARIALPKIGAGVAGGDWTRIKDIIATELSDCHVIIVNYNR